MKSESLALLQKLLTSNKSRERRQRQLLRTPEQADVSWFMCVPPPFNAALDILRTEHVDDLGVRGTIWTQGSNFSFSAGDVLYDSSKAYDIWERALSHIRTCFRITAALSVVPPTKTTPRFSGEVSFTVLSPNNLRTALMEVRSCKMTQDEFVRQLITGFQDDLPPS